MSADAREALFYRLGGQDLAGALPKLLETCRARGWRATVRAGTRARVEALSDHLWAYRDDGFLPHGDARDGRAADQPVWLTERDEAPNDPHVLFLVDGVGPGPEDFQRYPRTALIFDGGDEMSVAAARDWWRQARDAGVKAVYWAQDEAGRWRKEAESGDE